MVCGSGQVVHSFVVPSTLCFFGGPLHRGLCARARSLSLNLLCVSPLVLAEHIKTASEPELRSDNPVAAKPAEEQERTKFGLEDVAGSSALAG